jgi:hypothetical protein
MGDTLLIETAKNLVPLGIFLRESHVSTHNNFDRHSCEEGELHVQFKSGPGDEYKATLDEKSNEGIMFFPFEAAVRLIDQNINEGDDDFVQLEISAIFEAEYQFSNHVEFNEEGMSLFLNANVPHHVWPYWREYVQSTCMRMGIAPIRIPLYRVSGKGD